MKKLLYICKEGWYLVKRHKLLFLAPFLIALAVLTLLAIQLGPSAVVSFIYAGL
jgi:hypothetical protein